MNTEQNLVQKLLHYLNLESELDEFEVIHNSIEKDIIFRGTNLWILIFAIIVASVGLNMNSTAVIIGAMLISPLMGPINGIGYSIATYNFTLLRKAINNFSFAVVAGLTASTTYFALSPVSTAHSELLARTSPTIYDVIIALFGGLAGIVAISSKQKGNVIPGVAIATALMPPLCTAGYGLATAQFYYFFGAIYLFTINTVFIALAATIVSQLLKFPITTIFDKVQKQRVNQWISIIILITLIPSVYLGYLLVQTERFRENGKRFVDNVDIHNGNYLLKYEIVPEKKTIKLIYGGSELSSGDIMKIKSKANNFMIDSSMVTVEQGFSFEKLNTKDIDVEKFKAEIADLKLRLSEKELELGEISSGKSKGKSCCDELKILFPSVKSCVLTQTQKYQSDTVSDLYLSILESTPKLKVKEKQKIEDWLRTKLKVDKVEFIFK
jgi:uncharacterized hydrophobic protein (TIGR00271 family)